MHYFGSFFYDCPKQCTAILDKCLPTPETCGILIFKTIAGIFFLKGGKRKINTCSIYITTRRNPPFIRLRVKQAPDDLELPKGETGK